MGAGKNKELYDDLSVTSLIKIKRLKRLRMEGSRTVKKPYKVECDLGVAKRQLLKWPKAATRVCYSSEEEDL